MLGWFSSLVSSAIFLVSLVIFLVSSAIFYELLDTLSAKKGTVRPMAQLDVEFNGCECTVAGRPCITRRICDYFVESSRRWVGEL